MPPTHVTTDATGGSLPERPLLPIHVVDGRLARGRDVLSATHDVTQQYADSVLMRGQGAYDRIVKDIRDPISAVTRRASALATRTHRNVTDYIDGRLAGHYAIAQDYGIRVPRERPNVQTNTGWSQPTSMAGSCYTTVPESTVPFNSGPLIPPDKWGVGWFHDPSSANLYAQVYQAPLLGGPIQGWWASQCGPFNTQLEADQALASCCGPPPPPVTCPSGVQSDPLTGQCITEPTCPAGTHYDTITSQCVPDTTCPPAEPCPPSCPPVMSQGDSCDNPLYVSVCAAEPQPTITATPWWCVDGEVSQSDQAPPGDDVIGPLESQTDAQTICAYYQETHRPKPQGEPQYGGDIAWATDVNSDDQVLTALSDIGVSLPDVQPGDTLIDLYDTLASQLGIGSYGG